MNTPDKKYTISKDTLMPLGMVIALCGGVLWISTQLSGIKDGESRDRCPRA